jgi:peroxiredoxin (alkyl hydroperoxide reductase subunit C)
MEEMKEVRIPLIGEKAPDFEAVTSMGKKKLSDFLGKWVVLFSHPADFTPVCTTEFAAFAEKQDEFKKRNVQLIGLSIDSVYSHIAWIREIEKYFGFKVQFPVIADLDMNVAHLYGMVHPGSGKTATVRTVFVIDDKGTVRAILYYPASNGRNIEEILRLVDALQYTDSHGVATPANWKVGEKVIVPSPSTVEDAEKRMKEDYEKVDWFLAFKKYENKK